MRPFALGALSDYCCCGGELGWFSYAPPGAGDVGLFCIGDGAFPKLLPKLLFVPFCPAAPGPFTFCGPAPNICNEGWYGVVIRNPQSRVGSYANCHWSYCRF